MVTIVVHLHLHSSIPLQLSQNDHFVCMTGTDATHAEHIETIKTRNYVGIRDDGCFVPGELGMGLVEGMLERDNSWPDVLTCCP